MKSVESPKAQLCSVPPGQLGAMLKRLFWKSNFDPQPAVPALLRGVNSARNLVVPTAFLFYYRMVNALASLPQTPCPDASCSCN